MSKPVENKQERDKKSKPGKSILLVTYGCQMNEYDSELIRSILAGDGYAFAADEAEADVILLNTCSVRDSAVRKIHGKVHALRHERGDSVKIGILGCVATDAKEDLLRHPHSAIDFIAGPDSYKRLPDLIRAALEEKKGLADIDLSEKENYEDIYPSRDKGPNAWIAVMRGCNNFCTFCIVPYTRGRERSRSPENILEEARRLADEGYKQVTLLGQNVNSYQHGQTDFAQLIQQISTVKGIERIRFTSPHPKDFPDDLLKVMANNPKVCRQIHLPLQSGNNRVLSLMNRGYTKEDFLSLVDKIRAALVDVALSTDIIVGFPTETDEEFADTVDVVQQVQFDSAFIFKYSERKGTIASKKYPDDVPEAVKTKRIVRLNEIQKEISFVKNKAHIGQTQTILIEAAQNTRSDGRDQGRTNGNKIVVIPAGPYACGDLVNVTITAATPHLLKGERNKRR